MPADLYFTAAAYRLHWREHGNFDIEIRQLSGAHRTEARVFACRSNGILANRTVQGGIGLNAADAAAQPAVFLLQRHKNRPVCLETQIAPLPLRQRPAVYLACDRLPGQLQNICSGRSRERLAIETERPVADNPLPVTEGIA